MKVIKFCSTSLYTPAVLYTTHCILMYTSRGFTGGMNIPPACAFNGLCHNHGILYIHNYIQCFHGNHLMWLGVHFCIYIYTHFIKNSVVTSDYICEIYIMVLYVIYKPFKLECFENMSFQTFNWQICITHIDQ